MREDFEKLKELQDFWDFSIRFAHQNDDCEYQLRYATRVYFSKAQRDT